MNVYDSFLMVVESRDLWHIWHIDVDSAIDTLAMSVC